VRVPLVSIVQLGRGMRVHCLMALAVVFFLPVLAYAQPLEDLEPSTAAPSTAASEVAPESGKPLDRKHEVPTPSEAPVLVGVNTPIGWFRHSPGASVYVGISPHHAIRANFAYYHHYRMLQDLASIKSGVEGVSYSGRVIDYGAAWVWYPGRRWQGFMLEAGTLLRDRAIRDGYEDKVVKNWTLTLAGRGLIGWTWRIGSAFVAAAVGLSAGYETGREQVTPETLQSMPPVTSRISRLQVDGEAYMRIGFAFGN
jgi:hypothetical protein